MGHALSSKWGISIKQSQKGRTWCIHKISRLKHHARIGFVESPNHWFCDWHSRLERSVQLIFVLQFWNTTYHSINWIGPVKIKDLISVQIWTKHDGKSSHAHLQGKNRLSIPSANLFFKTSSLLGNMARLTSFDMLTWRASRPLTCCWRRLWNISRSIVQLTRNNSHNMFNRNNWYNIINY